MLKPRTHTSTSFSEAQTIALTARSAKLAKLLGVQLVERNSNPGLGSWPSFQIEGSRWSPVTSQRISSRRCAGSSCRCAAHAHSVVLLRRIAACIQAGLKGSLKGVQTPLHAHTYLHRFRNVSTNCRMSCAALFHLVSLFNFELCCQHSREYSTTGAQETGRTPRRLMLSVYVHNARKFARVANGASTCRVIPRRSREMENYVHRRA
jgi:hypothetical protein